MANLANHLRFAKLKPSKLVVTIDNPLADLFIRQTFSAKRLKIVDSPNILPAKLSRCTVLQIEIIPAVSHIITIYRIGGLFGGDFNLAVWRIFIGSPNLNHAVLTRTHKMN